MRMFEYTCGNCGKTYRALQPASSYGTLVFRDGSGRHTAAVEAIGDDLFAKVGAALDRHTAATTITDRRRGQVVQTVVGRLSDPAPGGFSYGPDAKLEYEHCGATSPTAWRAIEPPEIIEVDVPMLERRGWEAMPPSQQEDRLEKEINDALSI
jgi:hypothetical protein